MSFTKMSRLLMTFFVEKKCILPVNQSQRTDNILLKLFNDISRGYRFIKSQKIKEGSRFNKIKMTKITSVQQVPKPKTFTANSFPEEVRTHIDNSISYHLSYTFSLYGREIIIHFLLEDDSPEIKIEIYNEYVEKILIWFYFINEYASHECSKRIDLYLYLTSLKKALPMSNLDILNQLHVNTGFTYTCRSESEIVIFRKEEWFKVLIHETFHNFGLDFSDMNCQKATDSILSIFKVNSEVNLFESYTEFWAEIMNAVFCSFYLMENKTDSEDFLTNFEFFIQLEISFKFFQMCKTLNFMGLTYKDLYSSHQKSAILRQTLYKEKSNILAYYIITTILLSSYQGFLYWCDTNNLSLLQFKKTPTNIMSFTQFIINNYKSKGVLTAVQCSQHFLNNLKKNKGSNRFIMNNMRMTLVELG
jgi:hypothetical protein